MDTNLSFALGELAGESRFKSSRLLKMNEKRKCPETLKNIMSVSLK